MKIKNLSICFFALLFIGNAQASSWTKEQVFLETGYLTVTYLDYKQTLLIADNNDEVNPILGTSPSEKSIQYYFISSAALHLLVSSFLSSRWRTRFQYVTFGYQTAFVVHNYWIGYQINF